MNRRVAENINGSRLHHESIVEEGSHQVTDPNERLDSLAVDALTHIPANLTAVPTVPSCLHADCTSSTSGIYNIYPTPSPSTSSVASVADKSSGAANSTNSESSVELVHDSHLPLKHPPPLINSEDAYCIQRQEPELEPNHLSLETTTKLCHVGPSVSSPPQLIPVSFCAAADESSNSSSYVNPKTECMVTDIEATGTQQVWNQTRVLNLAPVGKANIISITVHPPSDLPWPPPSCPTGPGFYHIQPAGGPEGSGELPVSMGFRSLSPISPISPTQMAGVSG